MRKRSRSRFLVADVMVVTVVAVVTIVSAAVSPSSNRGSVVRDATLTIGGPANTRPVPPGYLGLSLELSAVEPYAGGDPLAIDPVFEQLIRNLSPGQSPVLRIGGDSADWTWWPVAGVARPPGVSYSLKNRWLSVMRTLTHTLGARLILGLNFEADNPGLAAAEAQAMAGGIGSSTIEAFELGNEPELYATFAWYHTPNGRSVPGRLHAYGYSAFLKDYSQFASALETSAGDTTLAGPATGGPGWTPNLAQFLSAAPQVRLVALHRYPTQLCFVSPSSPRYPTIAHLLSNGASKGLADGFKQSIETAHARGLPIRIDELNTVSCGADAAVSDTFASALWALDALFEIARVGADGVNIHTFPGAGYELFRIRHVNGRWSASVAPEYYGLLMFAQAAPPGSQLLHATGRAGDGLKAWATRARDGTLRVVLINKGRHARVVSLRLPQPTGSATLTRLIAPSATASTGVTFGGQSFRVPTTTGLLDGQLRVTTVGRRDRRFVVTLPSTSAALLTFVQ
jgi:Glycosyl hydrolase family 79 C-terminal beta domain